MFPFHQEASIIPADPADRLKLKENVVLIDSDAMEYSAADLQAALRERGVIGMLTNILICIYLYKMYFIFNFIPFFLQTR